MIYNFDDDFYITYAMLTQYLFITINIYHKYLFPAQKSLQIHTFKCHQDNQSLHRLKAEISISILPKRSQNLSSAYILKIGDWYYYYVPLYPQNVRNTMPHKSKSDRVCHVF